MIEGLVEAKREPVTPDEFDKWRKEYQKRGLHPNTIAELLEMRIRISIQRQQIVSLLDELDALYGGMQLWAWKKERGA